MKTDEEQKWHAWRTAPGAVTASQVAAAYTGHYGGISSVVAKRLGLESDTIPPELAERGHRWEPALADIFSKCTGLRVIGEQQLVEAATNQLYRATVDGFVVPHSETRTTGEILSDPQAEIELVEFKTRTALARSTPWDYYTAQVQWALFVTGLSSARIVVGYIIDGSAEPGLDECVSITIRQITADPTIQAELVEVAESITRWISVKQVPTPTSPAEASRFVTSDSTTAVRLEGPQWAHTIERLRYLKDQQQQIEDEIAQIEADWVMECSRQGALVFIDGAHVEKVKPRRVFDDKQAMSDYPEYIVLEPRFDRAKLPKHEQERYLVTRSSNPVFRLVLEEQTDGR